MEQYIDLTQFMTHVAIEQFIAENDGILGVAGMNNFYLYRFQGTQKHRLFVWDKDNAFLFTDSPIATTDDNVLFRRAMTYPDLRETYLQDARGLRAAVADRRLAAARDRSPGRHHLRRGRAPTRKKQFDNDRFDERRRSSCASSPPSGPRRSSTTSPAFEERALRLMAQALALSPSRSDRYATDPA